MTRLEVLHAGLVCLALAGCSSHTPQAVSPGTVATSAAAKASGTTSPSPTADAVAPDPRKPLITGEHVEERMNCAAAAKLTTAPTVTLVLASDTPEPRCAYARLSQRLIVENRTGQTVLITIGSARVRTLDGRDAVVSLRDAVDAPGRFQVHVYPGHGPSLIIVL